MEEKLDGIKLTLPTPELHVEISAEQIIEWFHCIYICAKAAQHPISYFGWSLQKNPMDLWIYQEIIVKNQPDIIIETGSGSGGSALYMAVICDILDHGRVVSIDIKRRDDRAQHPRIEYLTGSSTNKDIVEIVQQYCADKSAMVILDSDHTKKHVINELNNYARFVSVGQYLIVEDTQINGHPVGEEWGEGPWEAVEEWLPHHPEFIIDKECERFLLTWNPNGYLKRMSKENT